MKPIKYLSLLLILAACQSTSNNEPPTLSRKTSDASVLFFNNIRKSAYHVLEMKDAGMNTFTPKSLSKETPLAITIVHHWRDDRASVMLDFRDVVMPVSVRVGNRTTNFSGKNIQNHLEIAVDIFKGLKSGETVSWSGDGDSVDFDNFPEAKETFRIAMVDFFNLTDNQKFVDSLN